MMAFDRTPSSPTLDPSTVAALRTALTKSVARGNHADDLHDLLCRTAREARDKGIQAERLLVILKDIWYALPDVVNTKSNVVENRLLQDLISRCIHEYYAI